MLAKSAALLGFAAVSALADSIGFSRMGDPWSFTSDAAITGADARQWTQPAFNDSAWTQARSGFSAGYSSGEATLLPTSTLGMAMLFRRTFEVSAPESVKWLTLRIDYSHAFVAYLNGKEVARRNLEGAPGTEVPFAAGATNYHSRDDLEEIDLTPAASELRKGTNVLAVQLHAHTNWFALCLSAELLANFTRGPFIQNLSSNHVQIIWRTPVPSDTRVFYGTNVASRAEFYDPRPATTHVATLTGLEPDTQYSYEVRSSAEGKEAVFGPATFRTFKPAGPLSFVVLGDGGWNSLAQYDIAEVIRGTRSDLVVQNGDNVYPSFTDRLADPHWFSVYQPQMAETPFYFALGNHDLYSGAGHYLEAFYLPTNSVPLEVHAAAGTSPEHYYSFDHGDAHFTVLFVPFLSQYQLVPGDPQYNWLTNDLASTSKPWKIVVFHVPMNSSSAHRFDDYNYNGVPDRTDISNVLLPVLNRYGVQLFFCGHEHGYERFNPIQGVHGITTAGGGVVLYGLTQLDDASAYYVSRYNCVRVTIEGDTLSTEALGTKGEVFDRMTICRALPAADGYHAAWHSPPFPVMEPSDGDGNRLGQVFEFQGEPIPAVAGQFANLGRAFVNHDDTHLFIGLEQVMIPRDSVILLFLEVPRLTGTASLEGIGDDRMDPVGQGAEGLDALSALSFDSFRPAIGCILGDEFADGQFRSFRRRNSPSDTGQGVFRLDAALTNVPGVQIEQFHSSPQTIGLLDEENANFIQLAIPLAELGGLAPGDVIRIGAVVNGAEGLALDSGFLGKRLSLDGAPGGAVLEGIPVVLAANPDPDDDRDGLTRSQELALGTDPNNADSDGDQLPDGWEVQHELNPLSAEGEHGGKGDPDADGADNIHEWIAGTNPHRSESVFHLNVERGAAGEVRLSWSTAPGRKYQVQTCTALAAEFVDLGGGAHSASTISTNLAHVIKVEDSGIDGRFFRVRIVPQNPTP